MDKITIVLDCDETLLEITPAFKDFCRRHLVQGTFFEPDTYSSQWGVWQNDLTKWKALAQQFYNTEEYANLPPVEGAVKGVSRLNECGCYNLVSVTSIGTDKAAYDGCKHNLDKFFGKDTIRLITNDLGFGNKKEALSKLNAKFLIDDYPGNGMNALENGIIPIIYAHPFSNKKYIQPMLRGETVDVLTPDGIRTFDFSPVKEHGFVAYSWPQACDLIDRLR